MKNRILVLLGILMLLLAACDEFVSGVDPFINQVEDERLTSEGQIEFLINGVKTRFSTTHDELIVLVEILSDAMFFDSQLPGASYPQFAEIDEGDIHLDNNSVGNQFLSLGELLFFSDNLLERVAAIDFSDAALKQKAQFTGNFYGGIARYFMAAYYGLNPNEPGGVIDAGPFIPETEMYQLALDKLAAALTFTSDAYELQVVNTLMARIYLIQGDYANARTHANLGMTEGVEAFASLHNNESDNYFWQQAGAGRTQAALDNRFQGYIDADPNEANRVLLEEIEDVEGGPFYRQAAYPTPASPLNFITWQENELILAELDLRGGGGDALNRVNRVRASHGIDALGTVDMPALIIERDKELLVQGLRLLDQRRLDAEYDTWHLDDSAWHVLPITERERNANPNL